MKTDRLYNNKDAREDQENTKGLRMKELTGATGLPRSAILHYVAQGLLPEPTRTGPNMAYYDPVCIERIQFIKAMQNKYSFPLSKIKRILAQKDQGKDVAPLIELSEMIFGTNEGPLLNERGFRDATGLNLQQIHKLIKKGLLLPLQDGYFNQQDVTIGRIYAQGSAMGTEVSDMIFYTEAARQIVDGEMRLRQKLTANLSEEQDTETTKRLIQAARAVRNYVIERAFQKRVASAQDLQDKRLMP